MTHIGIPGDRVLDVEVTGPEQGFAFVMQHGTPGSRVRFRAIEGAVHRRGLRMITYSRPGYGGSTRVAGRRVADVAEDLADVLDHLGIERCVTLGWSGGGPHALAAAALLPGRVAAATAVASIVPYGADGVDFLAGMGEDNIEEFGAALAGEATLAPALAEAAASMTAGGAADLIEAMSGLLPEVDRAALDGEGGEDFAAQLAEALRSGVDGWVDDDLAFVTPWGFDVEEIKVPTFLWQGEEDLMVPFAHGRWLADRVPGAVAHLLPGEGHLSVFTARIDEVLDELLEAGRAG